jgi:heptaprenyl diphosphate synthase
MLMMEKAKGIERSRTLAKKYTKKAYRHIDALPDGVYKDAVRALADFLVDRAY